MSRFYFRLIIGIIGLVAAVIAAVSGNFTSVALYGLLGAAFLYSAYTTWKKEKGNRGQ